MKRATDRARAQFHVPHTAVEAGRVQAGVLLSVFSKCLVNDGWVENRICVSLLHRGLDAGERKNLYFTLSLKCSISK